MKKKTLLLIGVLILSLVFTGCRNETQNQIRLSIQDFTAGRMYITLFGQSGEIIYNGIVDGQITRSSTTTASSNQQVTGSFVFWFDEAGRYHQTNLPYLLTSYDRSTE